MSFLNIMLGNVTFYSSLDVFCNKKSYLEYLHHKQYLLKIPIGLRSQWQGGNLRTSWPASLMMSSTLQRGSSAALVFAKSQRSFLRAFSGNSKKNKKKYFFVDAFCNGKSNNTIQFLVAFTKMSFVFESDIFSRSYDTCTCCSA